jgi:hypothetical protein
VSVRGSDYSFKWHYLQQPVPVAAQRKAWVCGRSPAEITGSNPTGDTDVCCECCVLSGRGLLRRADHSSRRVLPNVVRCQVEVCCDELITRPEESYRMLCVVVCDLETSRMRSWPSLGRSAIGKTMYGRTSPFKSVK